MNALDEGVSSTLRRNVRVPPPDGETDSGLRWRECDTFRVVGICANGRREVVWRHVSRSLAERVRQMLQETCRYDDVSLEAESGASALAGPANRRAS